MGPYLLIALGGAIGANARYLVSTWAANRVGVEFPYGTFLVNASGSLLMGFFLTLVGNHISNEPDVRLLIGTGFLGSYTTFSTFAYETVALVRRGAIRSSLVNALGSTITGIAGVGLGMALADVVGRSW